MRSRSSVLSHILGSNPDICGYYELQQRYLVYRHVIAMRRVLHKELKCSLKDKYLFDKILHNRLRVSKKILKKMNPKIIFLLREPVATLKSMINLGQITGVEWFRSPKMAVDYYCNRLSYIEEFSKEIEGNYLFLESDDLVNHADHVLRDISRWLDLQTPLQSQYSLFESIPAILPYR